jgi:hypothetical protein
MQNLIGLRSRPVEEFVPELLGHFDQLRTVTFVLYKPAPVLGERLKRIVEPHSELLSKADQLNREYGIPFWDAFLSIEMKSGVLSKEYVDLAILHDAHPDERAIELTRGEATRDRLRSIIEDAGPEYGVALSSRVRIANGEYAHIPMLDFRCKCSAHNVEVVKWAVAAIGHLSGAVVNSGRSFHFYGMRLLTVPEWLRFISLAALFSPVVDARYLAHRLADGACRLRITGAPGRPSVPFVEEVFSDGS